jgi:hypothetical protein
MLGFGVILVYSYWEAQRLRYFAFEFGRMFRVCVVAGLAAAIFYALRPANLWLQSVDGLICIAVYSVGVWSFCLDREERMRLRLGVRSALSSVGVGHVETAPV